MDVRCPDPHHWVITNLKSSQLIGRNIAQRRGGRPTWISISSGNQFGGGMFCFCEIVLCVIFWDIIQSWAGADVIVLSALNINGFLSQNQHKRLRGSLKISINNMISVIFWGKSIILPKYPLKCDVLERQWCRQRLRIFLFEIIPHDFYNFLSPVQIIRVQRSPLCWVSLWPRISVIGTVVLRHPLCWMDWTGLVPWFDAIIRDVMLLCWPRRINIEFTDTLWHHWHQWRAAPSGLKEIFSETIMIMSRQIDLQPSPPLAVSAFQFLLPVFPPKSNFFCPLLTICVFSN